MTAEDRALLADLALLSERVDLEPARISQDIPIPRHELVKSAHLGDELWTGPQEQVVRVPENDLGRDRAQVVRSDRLDRRDRADGHELGRIDFAVRQRQLAPASRTVPVRDLKIHTISMASP